MFACTPGAAESELRAATPQLPHDAGSSEDDAKPLLEASKDNQTASGHFNPQRGSARKPSYSYTLGRLATANTALLSLTSPQSKRETLT